MGSLRLFNKENGPVLKADPEPLLRPPPVQGVKGTMRKFDARGKLRLYPEEMKAPRSQLHELR